MKNEHVNIDDELLASYLAGEANAGEREVVEQWISQSESNKQYFSKVKTLWENTGTIVSKHEADVDVDLAWGKFKQKANQPTVREAAKPKVRKLSFYLSRIAAILVLGFAVYLIYQSLIKAPANNEVVLAATALTKSDTLPDGSQVSLNSHSIITFNENFSKEKREVVLKGEAYFDVVKNNEKPFVIKTNGTTVTVLGTSFYVEAYDSLSTIEVGVEEGIVQIESYGQVVRLRAGEHISIDKNKQQIGESTAYNPNDIYWKSETLTFQNEPLLEVFATLEKVYEINISVDNPQILKCRLTGKFYKESPTHILEIIEANFGLTSVEQNTGFTISGNGCE